MTYATGWLPELPDHRDWDAVDVIEKDGFRPPAFSDDSPAVDIRPYCSPVEDQGRLGSCTAQAVAGLVEYLERRIFRRHTDVSRLFLYKVARQLDGFVGDTGAYIRTAMKGLFLFGAPPERFWPYNVAEFDADPSAFVYAYGQSLQSISYYRVDQPNRSAGDVLKFTKALVAGFRPVVLGFRVYGVDNAKGEFPFPESGERPRGGHAVMVVGYDDNRVIGNYRGALLVRNSWGTGWGEGGYGWLPYEYVLRRLASDFWTLNRSEWVTR